MHDYAAIIGTATVASATALSGFLSYLFFKYSTEALMMFTALLGQ